MGATAAGSAQEYQFNSGSGNTFSASSNFFRDTSEDRPKSLKGYLLSVTVFKHGKTARASNGWNVGSWYTW